jgi:hypothetical protein
VLRYDRRTHESVICSGWGPRADWVRNIRAHPALQVRTGRESFVPQRFLSPQESFAVAVEFRGKHPRRLRLIARVLGCDLTSDAAVRKFVRTHPFVALRPAAGGPPSPSR